MFYTRNILLRPNTHARTHHYRIADHHSTCTRERRGRNRSQRALQRSHHLPRTPCTAALPPSAAHT
ncbi:hypothetical protein FOA52_003320 [Chlamydomonas sp. UWO 241]|nr:hypothetical protein FOA52_003320 [Chlamydomonas sp. UWO 241]